MPKAYDGPLTVPLRSNLRRANSETVEVYIDSLFTFDTGQYGYVKKKEQPSKLLNKNYNIILEIKYRVVKERGPPPNGNNFRFYFTLNKGGTINGD